MLKRNKKVTLIVFMGLMIALEILFERLISISTATHRFSFTYVPRSLSGVLFGLPAAIVAVVADLIGGFISYGFSINPGITLACALRGLTYGFLLHKKRSVPRVVIAAAIDQFFCGLVVTTISLILMGYMPKTWASFGARVPQCLILFAIEIVLVSVLLPFYDRLQVLFKSYTESEEDTVDPMYS